MILLWVNIMIWFRFMIWFNMLRLLIRFGSWMSFMFDIRFGRMIRFWLMMLYG